MKLGLLIAGGVVLLVGSILAIVVSALARYRTQLAQERAALEHEGIVLDGGAVRSVIRFRDFRAPGMYRGRAIEVTRRLVVLTSERLAILGGVPTLRVPRSELHRFAVGLDGAQLRLVTDAPPGASGHIDLRLAVTDAEKWVTTLHESGCTLIG